MFFSRLSGQRHAMKSALAAASPLFAFHVRDHSVQQTAEPIAPRQQYEKYFTIAGSPESHAKGVVPAINHLVVSAPGVTFVSYDATATVPSVKISAEVPEVLEAYEVVEHGASGLEIRLRNRLDSRQYVLTEVSLPIAQALRTLEVRGSGTVVVEDGVLPTNDPHAAVAIRLSGSGDVFANSLSDVRVGSLALDLAGSGDIQLVAPSVTLRDAFETQVSSSGGARIFVGSITAPRVALNTAGSGSVQLAALSLEALAELNASVSGSGSIRVIGESLKTGTIQSSIAGSGGLKLVTNTELVVNTVRASVSGSGAMNIASTNARCADGKFSVAGSGTVDARDLVAHHAATNVSGSGAILVRAGAAVEAVTSGSGSVTIVGDLPPRVTGSPRTQTEEQKPSKLEALAAKRSPSKPNPTRVEAFEKLPRFDGTFHVQSFSDFVKAVKTVWNSQKDDRVEIQMKFGSAASDSDEPRTHSHP